MSEKFCTELIEEVEHYGIWSDGKNRVTSTLPWILNSFIGSSQDKKFNFDVFTIIKVPFYFDKHAENSP